MFENSYKIRVSSRAIILDGGKILLVEYGDGQYYNFIGGGIEENETAKQAVAREVLEESGLTVDVGELVFALEYEPVSCDHRYGKGHHISFFFRCHLNTRVSRQKPSHADISPEDATISSTAKWIPVTELSNIHVVPQITKPLIKYFETGAFEPLFWAECEHIG